MFPEFAFRQVEPIFSLVVRNHPEITCVAVPVGLAPESYANRLRKCAKDLLYFRWTPNSFDLTQFETIWQGNCVVRPTPDGKIQIGPKLKKGELLSPTYNNDNPTGGGKSSFIVNECDERLIHAFLTIAQYGYIKEPVHFVSLQDATELQRIIPELYPSVYLDTHPNQPGYLLYGPFNP